MKYIPLTNGQRAIVDDEDYDRLSKMKWLAWMNPCTKSYYAVRRGSVRMHRMVLGLDKSDRRVADHINHDTLDNRRCNLRIATRVENGRNCKLSVRNTSGHKGVHFRKREQKWVAYIRIDGRHKELGYFPTLEEARAVRVEAVKQHYGEFAFLG